MKRIAKLAVLGLVVTSAACSNPVAPMSEYGVGTPQKASETTPIVAPSGPSYSDYSMGVP